MDEDGHLCIEARAYIQNWRIGKSPAGLRPIWCKVYQQESDSLDRLRFILAHKCISLSIFMNYATYQHSGPKFKILKYRLLLHATGGFFQSMDDYGHWRILLPVSWTKIQGWSGSINIERGDEGYLKAWNKLLGSLDYAERDGSPSVEHVVPSMDWGRIGLRPLLKC